MEMRRQIFVTGGTGYVGRQVISALLARGHRVRALVRAGSEWKVPPGSEVVTGDPLDRRTFSNTIPRSGTYLQLLGVPHPTPAKAHQFREVDLRSALESIAAAQAVGVRHFVYVSVAQPAPIMRAYQAVRAEAEQALSASGLRHTVVRPWYVLGPGHQWPYALLPMYWLLERCAPTRASAQRLGLVTLDQMVGTLVTAIEHPPRHGRIIEVPSIRMGSDQPAGRSSAAYQFEGDSRTG